MADRERRVSVKLEFPNIEEARKAVEELGKAGVKALGAFDKPPPTAGLKALNAASLELQATITGLADRTGSFGAILGALGPAGIGAAAVIGGVGAVLYSAAAAAVEAEAAHQKLNAVLNATGNSTGFTTKQLDEYGKTIERRFSENGEVVTGVMAQLATYNTISGQVFKDVLVQAENLSKTFGGDLSGNAKTLADTLQKLANGESVNLTKQFGYLNAEQRNLVTRLSESGKGIESQEELLKSLQGRIGGTGDAANDNVVHSLKEMSAAWGDLLEELGNSEPIQDSIKFVTDLAKAVTALTDEAAKPLSLNDQADNLKQTISRYDEIISRSGNNKSDDLFASQREMYKARLQYVEMQIAKEKELAEVEEAAAKKRAEEAAAQNKRELAAEKAREEARELAKRNQEKAKQEAEAAAKAYAQAGKDIDDYIRSLGEENQALKLNARDSAAFTAVKKAEGIARRGNRELTDQETASIRAQALANYDAKKSADELAKRQQEATRQLQTAIENSSNQIVNFSSDAFSQILAGGKGTFEEIADSAIEIMRKAFAQIAAEAIIRPIVAPVISGVLGGGSLSATGIGGSAGGAGSLISGAGNISSLSGFINGGLYSEGLAGWGAQQGYSLGNYLGLGMEGAGNLSDLFGGALGNAGYGALGGVGASLLGLGSKNPYINMASGTLGTLAGGAIGTSMGTILGLAGGPIGAIAGGFLGTALGGLFGGNAKPSNHSAYTRFDLDTGEIYDTHDVKGTKETKGARDALAEQIKAIAAGIEQTTGLQAKGQVSVFTGTRDKTYIGINGQKFYDKAGQTDDLLKAFVQNLPKVFDGLSASIQTVLQKGGDVETMLSNVDFAQTYDALQKLKPIIPEAAQAFGALADEAEAFAKKADELGLSGSKALAGYAIQFNEQARLAIQAIENPLQLALEQEKQVADARLETAKKLGADISQVEKLNALEREQILKQYGLNIKDWLSGQALGSTSNLTKNDQLALAQNQFTAAVQSALAGGDASKLTGYADTLLGLQKDVFGGASQDYSSAVSSVRSLIESVAAAQGIAIGKDAAKASNDNTAMLVEAGNQQTEAILDQLKALTAMVAEVAREKKTKNGLSVITGG